MKTHYLTAACFLAETDHAKVLFDPWLSETAFYSAWAHDPPILPRWRELDDITAIVVSHLHQDHMDLETLARLPRVPVYIPRFKRLPMARILRARQLDVREVPWWQAEQHHDITLRPLKPTGPDLDSAWAIEKDGRILHLNLVDCPTGELGDIYEWLGDRSPDEMALQYAASGPYPHCFLDMTSEKMLSERDRLVSEFLQGFAMVTRRVRPAQAVPFAVGYRLRGMLAHMNELRPIPEARNLRDRMELTGLPLSIRDQEYATKATPLGREELDFEQHDHVDPNTIQKFAWMAEQQWPKRCGRNGEPIPPDWELVFSMGETSLSIRTGTGEPIPPDWELVFSMGETSLSIRTGTSAKWSHRFVLDPRQMFMLLTKQMRWDNALGSSQIMMERRGPFDRQLYRALSYFHLD